MGTPVSAFNRRFRASFPDAGFPGREKAVYTDEVTAAPTMPDTIHVLNGPNLNLLGSRQPEIYGRESLDEIRGLVEAHARDLGLEVVFRQSNAEGELVTWIQQAGAEAKGIIINAAGYTHGSVAILDALLACGVPVVEVHLSNLFRREDFRRHSYVSQAARGVICGFGAQGYVLAVEALAGLIGNE